MSKMKKIVSTLVAVMMVFTLSTTAFADYQSSIKTKSMTGYSQLYGRIMTNGSYKTSVTSNGDNAYLTFNGEVRSSAGNLLYSKSLVKSDRGDIILGGTWDKMSSASSGNVIYGTHGVRGGTTYGSAAVYTSITVS